MLRNQYRVHRRNFNHSGPDWIPACDPIPAPSSITCLAEYPLLGAAPRGHVQMLGRSHRITTTVCSQTSVSFHAAAVNLADRKGLETHPFTPHISNSSAIQQPIAASRFRDGRRYSWQSLASSLRFCDGTAGLGDRWLAS